MTFAGFELPQENWSKLPHAFIEALPLVETIGEMKVILYILRHTWGYQEFGEGKKITLDEFENGRAKRDGTRLDAGTGLTRPTIIDGLNRAEAHGFIIVETDESDAARVKKFYCIKMIDNQGSKDFTPGVKSFYIGGKESLPRSEKDTQGRNFEEETIEDGADAPHTPNFLALSLSYGEAPADCDEQDTVDKRAHFMALAEVCSIMVDLASVNQKRQLGQSAKLLREKVGAQPEDIVRFRAWWDENDWRGKKGQAPTPAQVREEWGKFTQAFGAGGQEIVRVGK
jgi:hypothetical protein